jgi:hypothetical protein
MEERFMAAPKKLMFNDGYVLDSNSIFLASQIQEYARDNVSRVSIILNGKWKYADFDDAALSVACRAEGRLIFWMGVNGNILVGGLGGPVIEKLPDAGKYDEVLRIRNIAGEIYICGMTGQVYHRGPGGWKHIDRGLLGKDGVDLEDIGGSGPDDLYAVGSPGVVYHFDGRRWKKLDFPSNRPVGGVKCVSKEEVYICGDNGNLFRGNLDGWEFIGDESVEHNFWAVEQFQGKLYVSFDGGLMVHDGTTFEPVDFGLSSDVDCHRLHANDGVLWSFGVDHLLVFDGKNWAEVVCPMNV